MNNEYIIINKTLLEKRIEELENTEAADRKDGIEIYKEMYVLKQILSQSTPLIPEIDKAYWAGMQFVGEDKGSPNEYITNLKLDI